ncbi:hypothetical protein [Aeoliella mucimassa]|nr:hypothetical protein [Aeoliella mucimassa]
MDKLESAGVSQAEKAVSLAREQGSTPEDVLKLIAWWSQHRNGWEQPALALYRRVCAAKPKLAPSIGWIDFCVGYRVCEPMPDETRQLMADLDDDEELRRVLAGSNSFPRKEWREIQLKAKLAAPQGLPRARIDLLAARMWLEREDENEIVDSVTKGHRPLLADCGR